VTSGGNKASLLPEQRESPSTNALIILFYRDRKNHGYKRGGSCAERDVQEAVTEVVPVKRRNGGNALLGALLL